ncbi:hypothetical protein CHS0354_030274 [Potamilus streckersoni]|uniref:Uncharacterized protein n=1 Tax=Potamilus streckersoni TaxID=2493646 RepID=A0AAE0RVA6_9BIVA|nr:hypothetical protein CHS0354_030274 [Potamilus streckersoni]
MLVMEPDPDEHLHPGEEDLAWTEERANLFKDVKPRGQYSLISDAARSVISTEKQCAFFCGGKKCKYCIGKGWKEEEMVIPGLYSHWVTDKILAMARPTNDGLQKYDQLKEFKKQGIQSILNLQTPGEHADCGPNKLDPSGFSYNPQAFMDEKIFFYNYGWPDYGVASLSKILDMVKVMQFSLSEGKIAVHCHAGRGRTGVIIACYLIFTNRMNWRDAIHYVREKRAGSIQTRAQIEVIEDFEKYLQPFRIVFASRHILDEPNHRKKGSHEFSLQQFLNRQKQILHGYEARKLKYLPKVVYTVCERLLELAQRGKALTRLHSQICSTSSDQSEPSILSISNNPSQTHSTPNVQLEPSKISVSSSISQTLSTSSAQSEPSTLSVSSTPSQTPSTASVQSEPSAISVSSTSRKIHKNASEESLFDLNSTFRSPSLALLRNKLRSISMEDLHNEQFKDVLDELDNKSSNSGGDVVNPVISKKSIANDGHDNYHIDNKFNDNLSLASQKSSDILSIASDKSSASSSSRRKKKKNVLRSKKLELDESDNVSQLSDRFDDERLWMSANNNNGSSSVERIVIGLVHEVSHSALEKAKQCETALNESDGAWSQIIEETDPQVLATILWDWLDQLKEPVLRVQDLKLILHLYHDPNTGLLKLEKGTSCMMQYFANVFSRLEPTEDELKIALYEKILSHLTHQWVVYDCVQAVMDSGTMTPRNLPVEEKDHWSDMKQEQAQKLFSFFLTLMESTDRRK